MKEQDSADAFARDTEVDEPGIVGARWWQDSLGDPVDRRKALTIMLAAGGAIAALGIVCAVAGSDDDAPGFSWQDKNALELQQTYGWDFGAVGEPLVFDGSVTQPFDRASLDHLVGDFGPGDPRLGPFYVGTLFSSVNAHASKAPLEDTASVRTVGEVLTPIDTPAMESAYRAGAAVAKLAKKRAGEVLVIADLDGPEAVAFAAGAAELFTPVFLFDNWPHPRGVVPSHLTLAAAAYYQPLFAKRHRSETAPALFVLDRQRLANYLDDSQRFDNRYLARLPPPSAFDRLGATEIWYVTPPRVSLESDDLNDFLTAPALRQKVYWASVSNFDDPDPAEALHRYESPPRRTLFSSGQAGGKQPMPLRFGAIPVAVALSGVIIGAKLSRSGSFLRATGSNGS